MTFKILKRSGAWVDFQFNGQFGQAKVYDEGSEYGINNGRTSKLVICSTPKWNHVATVYSYDRGLDFSDMDQKDVDLIVAELEALPAATR